MASHDNFLSPRVEKRSRPHYSQRQLPSSAKSLFSGFIGACTVTLINEVARRYSSQAPRLDLLGMRALDTALRTLQVPVSSESQLRVLALLGDLATNTLYYRQIAHGHTTSLWLRGVMLGSGVGIGVLVLSPLLGFGTAPVARTQATCLMTIGWYLAGGLAAAGVASHTGTSYTRSIASV